MIRVFLLALAACSAFGGDFPRILFFSNPMQSDNDVVRRKDTNTLSVAETNFARITKGFFDVTLTQRGADITAESIRQYDAIVFFTAINPPDVAIDAMIDWVKAGGAFVGIHSTANTYQGHAGFGELLGARFDKRPWRTREAPQTKMRLIVNDRAHPSTRHITNAWELADDLYTFKNIDRTNINLLLSLDPQSLDMAKVATNENLPVAWTKNVGKGRMFYTALGDWEPTWRDPRYEAHLIEGIRWAMSRPNARPPKNETDLRYWLENVVAHHRFSIDEVREATGLSTTEIKAALARFEIKPAAAKVLPYPGGRHPRIGFLDGAIDPQRETKISVFTPWDPTSYVVIDVPEAIFSNLGLTYLAHTHIPTIWDQKKIALEPLEWERHDDGRLTLHRKLPNGIEFGTDVTPETNGVRMRLWLKNGTDQKLTDMRVQTCVMLKGAKGFEAQTNANKILKAPAIAAHSSDRKRWIVTEWEPLHRVWANPPVPCLHADPKLPDADPGQTVETRGRLFFHEGAEPPAILQ